MVKKIIFLLFAFVSVGLSKPIYSIYYNVHGDMQGNYFHIHLVEGRTFDFLENTEGSYSTSVGSTPDYPGNGNDPSHTSGDGVVTGTMTWTYNEIYNVYVINVEIYGAGATPPPEPVEVYDFSEQVYEYNSTADQMVTLQYYDDSADAWVDLKSFILKGKKSALDDPFSWSFGSTTAPVGITDWNIKYENFEVPPSSSFYDEWSPKESGAYTYEIGDGPSNYSTTGNETVAVNNPTSYDINQTVSPTNNNNPQVSLPQESVSDATGMSNANPSNTLENTAVGVAGGIKLAKGEISQAVQDGVAGLKTDLSGKANDIISAINGINADGAGGATAGEIQGIVDGVGAGEVLESTATESDFSDVSTNINSSAGRDAVDRMGGKLETFLSDYEKPIFPQGFGAISSLSFSMFNSSVQLDFNQGMWATLRSFLVWLIYALSFFGLLKILRRGIA